MNGWRRSAAGLVIAFVLGLVAGAAALRGYMARSVRLALAGPAAEMEPRLKLLFLTRALDLSAAQQEAIRPALMAADRDLRPLRARIEPDAAVVRSRERAAVRAALNEAQRSRFDAFVREQDRGLGRATEP